MLPLVVGACLLAGCAGAPVEASAQSDYPILCAPFNVLSLAQTLEEQVAAASVIVEATVVDWLPYETRTISGSGVVFGFVRFEATSTLKGHISREFTITIASAVVHCTPNFAPGDKFMLFLVQDDTGEWYSVGLQDAYWYIAADNKVYPAVLTDELMRYSGTSLSGFKQAISAAMR